MVGLPSHVTNIPSVTHVELASTMNVNSDTMVLATPVDWLKDDKIIATSTSLTPKHAEEFTIVSVANGGKLLKVTPAAKYRHLGKSCFGCIQVAMICDFKPLGWNSLDDRRSMARRILLYKMNHNLVPDYLTSLMPQTVGARVGSYVLRNAGDLTGIRTKKSQFYLSFLPKTIREWNNNESAWRGLDFAPLVDSFRSRYKKLLHRSPNKCYNIELENGNVHHTRLRLGLSHLRAHLFQYNLIANPVCQFCDLEPETTGHFILRCPSFHAPRTNYLLGLIANLDMDYINDLNDEKILQLFLCGDLDLDDRTNELLFTMALTFINSSKRFDMRIVR